MRLPLSDDVVVSDMVGKSMSLVTNRDYSPIHEFLGSLSFLEAGATEEGYSWETDNGALRILDVSGSCLYEFRSLETKNDCVYLMGTNLREERKGARSRVILHFKRPLAQVKSAICISSHAKYREDTLPPLLKSLKKAGLNMGNVYVSVAACDKEKSYDDDGVHYREIPQDHRGFTALSVAAIEEAEMDYWLLLHDTCTVQLDFDKKVAALDVGLNPDIVLFREPGEYLEMGLYRSDFLATAVPDMLSLGPSRALQGFLSNSRVTVVLGCNIRHDGEKDVYGTGVRRKVLVMPSVGIQKFQATAADGGKP